MKERDAELRSQLESDYQAVLDKRFPKWNYEKQWDELRQAFMSAADAQCFYKISIKQLHNKNETFSDTVWTRW
jgi:hypothetical protein